MRPYGVMRKKNVIPRMMHELTWPSTPAMRIQLRWEDESARAPGEADDQQGNADPAGREVDGRSIFPQVPRGDAQQDQAHGQRRLAGLVRLLPSSLHFSPRGEAKCVRGPSSTRREPLGARRRT